MHRSGTSAIAGVLGALGLSLPVDLMTGGEDNPAHNESWKLSAINDALLGILGGSWDDPPQFEPGWERRPDLIATTETVASAVAAAFPMPDPAVWKDPRTSLLFPYWRSVLSRIDGVVLVWRSPLAVVRSLQRRNDMSEEKGFELWRRYNTSALGAIEGTNSFVIEYDSAVDDPLGTTRSLSKWLSRTMREIEHRETTVEAASRMISAGLRNHERSVRSQDSPCDALTTELSDLSGRGQGLHLSS